MWIACLSPPWHHQVFLSRNLSLIPLTSYLMLYFCATGRSLGLGCCSKAHVLSTLSSAWSYWEVLGAVEGGVYWKVLGHWGHFLEEDIGTLSATLCFLETLNRSSSPYMFVMMYCVTPGPKQQGHMIMDWKHLSHKTFYLLIVKYFLYELISIPFIILFSKFYNIPTPICLYLYICLYMFAYMCV